MRLLIDGKDDYAVALFKHVKRKIVQSVYSVDKNESLSFIANPNDNTVLFTTTHFSEYAVVYEDEVKTRQR